MKKICNFSPQSQKKDKIKISIISVFFILSVIISILLAHHTYSSLTHSTSHKYSTINSLRYLKKNLGLPRSSLVKELGLQENTPNKQPLYKFNTSKKTFNLKIKRALLRHHAKNLKNSLFYLLAFFGLTALIYTSQRNQKNLTPSSKWKIRRPYILALTFSILVCGFLLGKSPNPMETLVKGIKILGGFYPYSLSSIVALTLLIACSIIGNKIICGWACPFGALQELIFTFSSKIKKYALPLYITNSIRIFFFLIALAVLFGPAGNNKGFTLYHYI
jgi:hypothetical protein